MTMAQLKDSPGRKAGPGDASEFENNIDQETRGGNLSSSAHDY